MVPIVAVDFLGEFVSNMTTYLPAALALTKPCFLAAAQQFFHNREMLLIQQEMEDVVDAEQAAALVVNVGEADVEGEEVDDDQEVQDEDIQE